MPTIVITITCQNPRCGQTVQKRWRTTSEPQPRYCTRACWFDMRKHLPYGWRKYTFTEAHQRLMRQALRKVGQLKAHWRQGAFGEVPYPVLKREARRLGIMRRQPDELWTPEEETLLEPYIERQSSLERMAKALKAAGYHRTPSAIRTHLWQRSISTRQGQWTLEDIAQGLDLDHHVVKGWVDHGKLKCSPIGSNGATRYYVTSDALRRFLLRYPYDAAHGDVRIPWIITMIAGSLPVE
jgi:hypothetical protein